MQNSARLMKAAYDQIAAGYDERWSVHIRAPQQRLTQGLQLVRGMRCADLGCGTGIDTLDMAELTSPEAVLAVDCSQKMLDEARARAAVRGHTLHTICTDAESFIHHAEAASFDVLSLRFCLAYLPWRQIAKHFARILRPRGKLGILTNLGTSAPQALAVYRGMVEEFCLPNIALPVPLSLEDLVREMALGGFRAEQEWCHTFHLWFDSGATVASWLAESGFITHPSLTAAPAEVRRALWDAFGVRMEAYRESRGIRLDFELAGLVATHD